MIEVVLACDGMESTMSLEEINEFDPATDWLPNGSKQSMVIAATEWAVPQVVAADGSLFQPGMSLWAVDSLSRVRQILKGSDKIAGKSFIEQLCDQFSDESDEIKQVLAEVLAFQMLPIGGRAMRQKAKLKRVLTVLQMMKNPPEVPSIVTEAFAGGSFDPGGEMNINVNYALGTLLSILLQFKTESSKERERLLSNPIALRNWCSEIPGVPARDGHLGVQVYSFLYTIFPTFFGPIVALRHRRAILERWREELQQVPAEDLDQDLHNVVIALQERKGGPVDFYVPETRSEWDVNSPRQKSVGDTKMQAPEEENAAAAPRAASGDTSTDVQYPELTNLTQVGTEDLSNKLLLLDTWIRSVLRSLQNRRQIILCGPPGTGKTYAAGKLSELIVASSGGDVSQQVRRIQFHPSYSYEDFFNGYRPVVSSSGQMTYRLVDGPLKQIASQAQRTPNHWHILLIDEINRANLPKVFGELYYLLEYRDESVQTMYSQTDSTEIAHKFRLPPNLLIIGTMNTSDRSIALLDSAMRRRFDFFELHPALEPLQGILDRWQEDHAGEWDGIRLSELLNRVNTWIGTHDDMIGPSALFVEPGPGLRLRLTDIWRQNVLPILQDRQPEDRLDHELPWFGAMEDHQE
jgi:nucleoside-triphosphatase THEP1